ncbi:transposase [Streptomyces sp. NPDC093707]|uniref:transposase n=1 Tax=Streptomyces sp. NPDC093707 TaxID=3154984 RepID=UPI00344EC3E0
MGTGPGRGDDRTPRLREARPRRPGAGNSRNGTSPKTVLTDAGAVTPAVPRDRTGSVEPRLVPQRARRLAGFNEQILSLYTRGMSVRASALTWPAGTASRFRRT